MARNRRVIFAAVSILLLASSFLAAQDSPLQRAPKITASHNDWTPAPQELFAPYWSLEPGWSTDLELRNNVPWHDLRMTPVLRAADGTEVSLAPVDLKPEEIVSVNLRDAVASAKPELLDKVGSFGSVVFRFAGTAAANGFAAAVVRREGHPIEFHFDAEGSSSRAFEGMWFLPTENATDYLIVSNPTNQPVTGKLILSDTSGGARQLSLTVASRQTVRTNLREVFHSPANGAFGGLSLSVAKGGTIIQEGSIVRQEGLSATEIVFDEVTGQATIMKLFDRQSIAEIDKVDNRVLRAPMMALSQPDPGLGFPSGTVLDPKIFLRNAGTASTMVSAGVSWRNGSASGTSPLPRITLLPGQMRMVNLADFQKAGQIPADAAWGTVTLGYTGRSGDLVAVATSYDKTSRYGLQTPFSEIINHLFKGSMWHVDATHNTLITTGNGGTEPTRAQVTLFYNVGQEKYRVEQRLSPGQQIWLNLGEVLRNQVPDSDGKTIPPDVMFGSYELRDLDHPVLGLLYEGKLIVDKTYGHASYGCAHCCGYTTGKMAPTPTNSPPNIDNQDTYQAYNACTSRWDDFDYAFSPWSSNTAVATFNGALIAHTVAAGTATVRATNTVPYGTTGGCPGVDMPAPGQQNVPSLSCTASVARGVTATCTVTPSGATVTAWQFKDSGNHIVSRTQNVASLTWSGVMVTSGTVSATIAGLTSPVTDTITVTNRNWRTNAASPTPEPNGFFITLPVPPQPSGTDSGLGYFAEDLGDAGFNVTILSGDQPNAGYGYYATPLSYSPDYFQYEINPDLQNTNSTFYQHQCGTGGFISGANLVTQTNRHEWNSATESHYAFYSSSLSNNNPGSVFESSVAPPGTNMTTFVNNSRSTLNGLYTQVGADASIEPYPVNHSETGVSLGNINYAPYTSCQ